MTVWPYFGTMHDIFRLFFLNITVMWWCVLPGDSRVYLWLAGFLLAVTDWQRAGVLLTLCFEAMIWSPVFFLSRSGVTRSPIWLGNRVCVCVFVCVTAGPDGKDMPLTNRHVLSGWIITSVLHFKKVCVKVTDTKEWSEFTLRRARCCWDKRCKYHSAYTR